MRRKNLLCLGWAIVIINFCEFVAGDAEPAILQNPPDLAHLRPFQSRLQPDPRPRLSSSQQQQILSDVQQHQRRYNQATEDNPSQLVAFPGLSRQASSKPESIEQSGFSSLAKYRVDRTKQQEQQQQQQQQQQTVKTDGGINFLQTAATQRYQPQLRQQLVNPGGQRFFDYQTDRQQVSPSQSIFEEEQKIRLNEYYEKQRQLEALKKQREQLILEQREIKRQQELLKLQQIRQQTSTTRFTTAAPTTPTVYVTTSSPLLLSSPTARRITPAESELFLKAIATHQKKFTTTTTTAKPFSTTLKSVSPPKTRQERVQEHGNSDEIPKDLLSLIQAQQPQLLAAGGKKPQIKIIYQTEKPSQTSLTSSSRSSNNSPSTSNSENELLLKQLKLALAQSADDNERNVTTRDLVLPNGKKLQLIQSPNGLSSIVPNDGSSQFQTVTKALEAATSTTTIRPAKAILDELTKGVLPPGADFEVLRHKDDGKLEDVGKSPIHNQPGKKVTFVVLEEQPDGSYKVQGVKGNAKENGVDVDSIVDKIKKGELKLPPRNSPTLTSAASSNSNVLTTKQNPTVKTTTSSTTYTPKQTTNTLPTTFRSTTIKHTNAPVTSRLKESSSSSGYFPYVTVSPNSISSSDNYVTSASTTSAHVFNSLVNSASTPRNPTSRYEDEQISSRYTTPSNQPSRIPTYSTFAQFNDVPSTTSSPAFSTTAFPRTTSYVHFSSNNPTTARPAITNSSPNFSGSATSENLVLNDFQLRSTVPSFLENGPNLIGQQESMTGLLRREGLFAMAKYLRQSGLDIVLNETGPYTIFVPTDKAFRTLLVQLGGPDKAEQKFRENPRLLSGLLLHHVIPGAFRMDSLQDEMTGVSLAGTQLRVNVYDMHDHEWNDVKVTTINGAKVAPNKRDIEIPQGIAHAIDRVMFPLPVGDLTQTLQADRERRFLTFLKILHASGLEETLAGTKTFTVFAPTDTAFANAAALNGRPVWIESDGPEAAKEIISRHIIPTTLYTGGMRYYHQRDTLRPQITLSIQKNGGRVRVNDALIVTHNVPATNGVIHAIDGIL